MGGGRRGSRTTYASFTDQNSKITDYVDVAGGGKRVFVSHHTADEGQVTLLRYQIQDERFGIEAGDTTVTTPYQHDWKTNVSINNIGPATHVICYVGPETHERRAVDWEIREAHRQGKKVIAIRPKDSNYKVPKVIREYGDRVVEWDTDKISYELQRGQYE